MMPDVPRPGHFDAEIYRGRDHFLWQQRAQSVRVLDAVLQRQHHRIRCKMRLDGSRTTFGVGGLHAKEHELRAPHYAHFSACRDANAFVEGFRFEPEPLTLARLDELRAPNQQHIVSGARQLEAVVAAHGTRTHYSDSFHWIMRV